MGQSMNHIYSGFRAYPGQRPQEYLGLALLPAAKLKGLICMPLKQEWNQDRGASTLHPILCGLRWIWNRSCARRYKHVHTYWKSSVSPASM